MVDTAASRTIDAHTRLYAVIGDPVRHSLGPAMHNAAFSQKGYNGVYIAFQVSDLPNAIAGIRALGIHGCSVTIPHKVAVMALLDEIAPMAKRIGAVNTIVNQNGRLVGFNSDSPGAMAALLEKTPVAHRQVAVIGAGGAARALAHGILAHGGHLTIVNRSPASGQRLARELNCGFCPLNDFSGGGCDILVNTTSVGMAPDSERMPVGHACLRPGMTVMDIVYNPLETKLLAAARDAGCTVVDGVAMFVHQGAHQFERWTGLKAPVQLMEKTVLNALRKKAEKGVDRHA
jgi:shikimate dehydrogenase